MACGIYQLRNRVTGNAYIGQAVDIGLRWKQHFEQLSRGDHHCKRLLSEFNASGPDAWECTILERCPPSKLDEREYHWMKVKRPILNTVFLPAGEVSRGYYTEDLYSGLITPSAEDKCERCDKFKEKGMRFCPHCQRLVKREMRRTGYLGYAPRQYGSIGGRRWCSIRKKIIT